jgi:hypothetical protein
MNVATFGAKTQTLPDKPLAMALAMHSGLVPEPILVKAKTLFIAAE